MLLDLAANVNYLNVQFLIQLFHSFTLDHRTVGVLLFFMRLQLVTLDKTEQLLVIRLQLELTVLQGLGFALVF